MRYQLPVISIVALLSACSPDVAFNSKDSTSKRGGASSSDGGDANGNARNSDGSNDPLSGMRVITKEKTTVIDTFSLATKKAVNDKFEVLAEPYGEKTCEQKFENPSVLVKDIVAQEKRQAKFNKGAPKPVSDAHVIEPNDKPLDIIIAVDNTENFMAQQRVYQAVDALIDQLAVTDWQIIIGGFLRANDTYTSGKILKSSYASTAAAKQAAQDLLQKNIFASSSDGDERSFRSLHRIAKDYKSSLRPNSTVGYMIMSDAANCKTAVFDPVGGKYVQEDNSQCTNAPGSPDHWSWLGSTAAGISADYVVEQKSLFAAYYRMTDNRDVCNAQDQLEPDVSPGVHSQYEKLALDWRAKYSDLPNGGPIVGDICSQSESLNWLSEFTESIKYLAATRLVLSATPDAFPSDPQYNLKVVTTDAVPGAAVSHTLYKNKLVLLPFISGQPVAARYHQANGFKTTDYPGIFAYDPEVSSTKPVTLSWMNGTTQSTTCENANSFDTLSGSVNCRYWGRSLYLRNTDFLPAVAAGAPAIEVTLQYWNKFEQIPWLVVNAGSDVFLDTVRMRSFPDAASDHIARQSITVDPTDGRLVTIAFPSNLPAGHYELEYFQFAHSKQSCDLDAAVGQGSPALVCYLPGAVSSIGSDGNIALSDQSKALACNLSSNRRSAHYSGRLPVDSASGKRLLKVGFKTLVAPQKSFVLSGLPDAGSATLSVEELKSGNRTRDIGAGEFKIDLNHIDLTQPIQPGERLVVSYTESPPLGDGCFELSARIAKDFAYNVTFGDPGAEAQIKEGTDYTLRNGGGSLTQVCLAEGNVQYGKRLSVEYITHFVDKDETSAP